MSEDVTLPDGAGIVDTFQRARASDGQTVNMQAIVPVDPATGDPLQLAQQATLLALNTAIGTLNAAAAAIQVAVEAMNGKTATVNTGAIAGTVALDGFTLAALESISAATGLAQPVTDAQLRATPIPVSDASVAAATHQEDSPHTSGDYGQLMLGIRWDSDTATADNGDYSVFKLDEAGRLKVATQPGSVPAATGNITGAAQTVFIQTNRISNLSISMVASSLVGHNCIFEVSNDSTNGTDGNWKTVQVVRTDSNTIETTTGVLAATPAYAWELNVASYAYFRIRCTAHASGSAAYTLKPGAYATEPVPSSQNPSLVQYSYSQAGVIAINTTLLTVDCLSFKSISVQCTSMGTTGVVTPQWSNDGVNWITATMLSESGVTSTTFNAAVLRNTNVLARYFRLQLTTATTAGTTTINVQTSQAVLAPIITTQPVSMATNTPTLAAGTNRAGFVAGAGIWYDDSATVLAAAASFTGTSRDLTVTATATAFANAATYAKELRVSAESDQSGTLWLEVSRDNTNWRRIKSVATATITGGAQYAEIIHQPSWRYARVGFTNGATLQTRFSIGSIAIAL